MSHFITISGADLSHDAIDGVMLVPLASAQPYIARLAETLMALDGTPAYLCADPFSSTSSGIVEDAQDHAMEDRSLNGTALLALLTSCERSGAVLRLWWADDTDDAHLRVRPCRTIEEVAAHLMDPLSHVRGVRYAPPHRAASGVRPSR